MADPRHRFLALSLLLFLGCGPSTPAGREADDRDVERDILWELRKDRRFADVRVACYDRKITLEGTVPDRAALDEVLKAVADRAYGAKITNSLVVRLR